MAEYMCEYCDKPITKGLVLVVNKGKNKLCYHGKGCSDKHLAEDRENNDIIDFMYRNFSDLEKNGK